MMMSCLPRQKLNATSWKSKTSPHLWVSSAAFGTHAVCCVPALQVHIPANTTQLCSFPLLVDTMCSYLSQFLAWRTSSSFREIVKHTLSWRLSICCRGVSALVSSVPGPSPPSTVPFSLGGLLPSSSPTVAGGAVGAAIWRRKQCQMAQGMIYRPFCISPSPEHHPYSLPLAASPSFGPACCLIQSPQNLLPPCLDLEARAEMNPGDAVYARAVPRKSETSVGNTSQWLLEYWFLFAKSQLPRLWDSYY